MPATSKGAEFARHADQLDECLVQFADHALQLWPVRSALAVDASYPVELRMFAASAGVREAIDPRVSAGIMVIAAALHYERSTTWLAPMFSASKRQASRRHRVLASTAESVLGADADGPAAKRFLAALDDLAAS